MPFRAPSVEVSPPARPCVSHAVAIPVHHRTIALVGLMGVGKSTVGRLVADLLRPSAGAVRIKGEDPSRARPGPEGLAVQMIFQDPISSLNPRRKVRDIVRECREAGARLRRCHISTRSINRAAPLLPHDGLRERCHHPL